MLDLLLNSIVLFCRGKLFKDPVHVLRQTIIGVVLAATLLVAMVKAGMTLGLAVVIAAFVTGVVQPWLFKDLKYA